MSAPASMPDTLAGLPSAAPPVAGPGRRWTVAVAVGSTVMAVGLVAAALARLPLSWDGAWFFVRAVDTGTPTFLFRRAVQTLLQAPAIATAGLTGDVPLAAFVFSAAYVSVPLLGLLAAWRVVRSERPELIAWAALGIALVALPGQAFFVSEGLFVADLVWALLLAAVLGRVGRHRTLVVGLVAILALSHPFAGPTLVAVGIVAWLARRRAVGDDGPLAARLLVITGVALALVSVGLRSPYEVEASSLGELTAKFRAAILDPAMIAPVVAWMIGLGTFARLRPRIRVVAVGGLLVLTAMIMVPWALDPSAWAYGLRFRAWYVIAALPLLVLAALDGLRPAGWTDRRIVVVGAPAVMALVLAGQAVSWSGLQDRLADSLAAAPAGCVTASELRWVPGTPLDHWSVTSLGLVVEGRDPAHLVLLDRPCAGAVDPSRVTVKVTPFDRDDRPVDGWWGFQRLVAAWPDESAAPSGAAP